MPLKLGSNDVVAAALRVAGKKRGPVVGPLLGATDGRADKLTAKVPNGSHIIPADVVSALGSGNSLAGFTQLAKKFPRSASPKSVRGARGLPKLKSGGNVKVGLSDGEFSVSPEEVLQVGGGNPEKGHEILNKWILAVRGSDIEQRKKLAPPV